MRPETQDPGLRGMSGVNGVGRAAGEATSPREQECRLGSRTGLGLNPSPPPPTTSCMIFDKLLNLALAPLPFKIWLSTHIIRLLEGSN